MMTLVRAQPSKFGVSYHLASCYILSCDLIGITNFVVKWTPHVRKITNLTHVLSV